MNISMLKSPVMYYFFDSMYIWSSVLVKLFNINLMCFLDKKQPTCKQIRNRER